MWRSSKIAYDVIIQQIQDGGLKQIDFGKKNKSFKNHMSKTINRWNSTEMESYTSCIL